MNSLLSMFLLTPLSMAWASPAAASTTVNCASVRSHYTGTTARKFCSSYVSAHPMSKTITVTSTETSTGYTTYEVTEGTPYTTIFQTITEPAVTITATTPYTVTKTVRSTVHTCVTGSFKKRSGGSEPNSAYTLSECACLGITPKTSTITRTTDIDTTIIYNVPGNTTYVPNSNTRYIATYVTSGTTTYYSSVKTRTVTGTPTTKPAKPPPGAQYAIYKNDQGPNQIGSDYANFNPDYIKAKSAGGQGPTPLQEGVSNNLSQIASVGNQALTYEYRGYINWQGEQGYRMNVEAGPIRDIAYLWVGDLAYSGWNSTNYFWRSAFNGTSSSSSFNFDDEVLYQPFRFIYANSGTGEGHLNFEFYAPVNDGDPVWGVTSQSGASLRPFEAWVIQYSCDGNKAPPFKGNFGAEH